VRSGSAAVPASSRPPDGGGVAQRAGLVLVKPGRSIHTDIEMVS
jgi:hypothetical protein